MAGDPLLPADASSGDPHVHGRRDVVGDGRGCVDAARLGLVAASRRPRALDEPPWNRPWQLAVSAAVGLALTLLAPYVVHGLTFVDRGLLQLLRQSRSDERIRTLEETRARSVDAAVEERRRIERDLHDGAQQRLVALVIDLGLALEKFERDPEARRDLVGEAHQRGEAGDRRVARPRARLRAGRARRPRPRRGPVRTCRSLAGSRSAATSPFPSGRRASVEANAYFIVAEALTNVARHGDATRATVDVAGRRSSSHRGGGRRRRRRRPGARNGARGPRGASRRGRRNASRSRARRPAEPPSSRSCRARRDRRGLGALAGRARTVARRAGHQVAAAAGDAAELLPRSSAHEPDIAIVDVRMPPTFTDEGVRAAFESRARRPELAVLVLSQYVEERYASELLARERAWRRLSAEGKRHRHRASSSTPYDASAGGGTAIDPEVVSQLLARVRAHDPLDELGPARTRGARADGAGPDERAIAQQLVVTERAVEKHVRAIFQKLRLPPADSNNRRVLAVLRFLEAAR